MYKHYELNRTAKKMDMINREKDEHDQHHIFNSLGNQIFIGSCLDGKTLESLGFREVDLTDELIAELLDSHQKSKSHREIYDNWRFILNRYNIFIIDSD